MWTSSVYIVMSNPGLELEVKSDKAKIALSFFFEFWVLSLKKRPSLGDKTQKRPSLEKYQGIYNLKKCYQ